LITSCNVVFLIFLIYTTFQSVINTKWLNFILTCGISLRTDNLTTAVIAELMNGHSVKDLERVRLRAIQLWCEVHGIISLHNSKLLREIDDNPARLINTLIEDVIARFIRSGGLSEVKASAT